MVVLSSKQNIYIQNPCLVTLASTVWRNMDQRGQVICLQLVGHATRTHGHTLTAHCLIEPTAMSAAHCMQSERILEPAVWSHAIQRQVSRSRNSSEPESARMMVFKLVPRCRPLCIEGSAFAEQPHQDCDLKANRTGEITTELCCVPSSTCLALPKAA